MCVGANPVPKDISSLYESRDSRGVWLSDATATVPNEAMQQRGKTSLISLLYLQKASQTYPKEAVVSIIGLPGVSSCD